MYDMHIATTITTTIAEYVGFFYTQRETTKLNVCVPKKKMLYC